ncbi:hypothetical protein [Stagnihabitans tardus]|nr:hypothetical protein [Stagnihabitans tardus]
MGFADRITDFTPGVDVLDFSVIGLNSLTDVDSVTLRCIGSANGQ